MTIDIIEAAKADRHEFNTSVDNRIRKPNASYDDLIVVWYRAGKGPVWISKQIGMSRSFVRSRLRANGIKPERQKNMERLPSDLWANDDHERRRMIARKAARGAARALRAFSDRPGAPPVVAPKPTQPPIDFVQRIAKVYNRPHSSRFREILAGVSERHRVLVKEITGPGRSKPSVQARAELCWLLRRHTSLSFPAIASKLGRDHSSLVHLVRKYGPEIAARFE